MAGMGERGAGWAGRTAVRQADSDRRGAALTSSACTMPRCRAVTVGASY